MPSSADLLALAFAAAAPAQDAPPVGAGPSAASNQGDRYDAVGFADAASLPKGAGHATLPVGSFVEVTSLDNGRTVLLMVAGAVPPQSGRPIALSPDAFQQLGVAAGAPVRVRLARPSPPDIAALRAGEPATARLDAPPVLLAGLRKELPIPVAASAPAAAGEPPAALPPSVAPKAVAVAPRPVRADQRPVQRPIDPPERQVPVPPRPQTAPASGWGVQLATLSNESNARAFAARLGGKVRAAGKLYRVQLGPFADRAAAEAARAGALRRGHAGATLVRIP